MTVINDRKTAQLRTAPPGPTESVILNLGNEQTLVILDLCAKNKHLFCKKTKVNLPIAEPALQIKLRPNAAESTTRHDADTGTERVGLLHRI